MGEYIKNMKTGEEIKIGVLDRCFYSRKQMEKWLSDPDWTGWYAGKEEEGTIAYYLNSSNTLYEGTEGLIHKDFAIEIVLDDKEAIPHQQVYIWNKGKRGNGYQYKVECQFKGKQEIWGVIVGERYDKNGQGRTIYSCDCCGALFSLPQDLLDKTLQSLSSDQKEYLAPILKARKESK